MKDENHFSNVLKEAENFTLKGKGEDRHGLGKPLNNQPWRFISESLGNGFLLGQAVKKIIESDNMDKDAAIKELFGAISYITFAIMNLQSSVDTAIVKAPGI